MRACGLKLKHERKNLHVCSQHIIEKTSYQINFTGKEEYGSNVVFKIHPIAVNHPPDGGIKSNNTNENYGESRGTTLERRKIRELEAINILAQLK